VHSLIARVPEWDRINAALYFDVMQLLPGNNLVKPDRMGMACSIEARNPFLDYRMVEFAFKMPGHLKVQGGELKYLLKRAVEPSIGHELAFRAKRMFTVPIGEWFRGALASFCRDTLLRPDAAFRELFRSRHVAQLLEAHVSGRSNYTRELRALIALELWAKEFEVSIL
jgi:asparagine synthase (glutamine-hydrolysing)